MDQQQLPYLFQVGDICVDRSTFACEKELKFKTLKIRKFVNNKAIVNYTSTPEGMVLAVSLLLLNTIDSDGFLRPSPYFKGKRQSDNETEGEKKMRKE